MASGATLNVRPCCRCRASAVINATASLAHARWKGWWPQGGCSGDDEDDDDDDEDDDGVTEDEEY